MTAMGTREDKENITRPWLQVKDSETRIDLSQVMRYAQEHYARHTDWYLRHRDSGIKTLGVLLTADFTIVGLHIADKVNGILAICGLGVVGLLSIVLTGLAIMSCKQAYKAALEHAMLVSKTAWALGWCSPITIGQELLENQKVPAWEDETLYIPRYFNDATKAKTTENFVQEQMKKLGTTYFSAKWTLLIIGAIAFIIAVGAITAIYWYPNKLDIAYCQSFYRTTDKVDSW